MKQKLDVIDIFILKQLQKDSSLSNKQIAGLLNKSQATITNRIKRLKNEGYILKTVAILNSKLLGNSVTSFISFKLDDISVNTIINFKHELSLIDGTCECYKIDGKFNVLLKVITKDLDSVSDIETKISGLKYVVDSSCLCVLSTIISDQGFDFNLD